MVLQNKYSAPRNAFLSIGSILLISIGFAGCSSPDPRAINPPSTEPSRSAQPIPSPSPTDNPENLSADVEKSKREAEQAKVNAEIAKNEAEQAKVQAESEAKARKEAEAKIKSNEDSKKRAEYHANMNAQKMLKSNESMRKNESRISPNGCYRLTLQDDGNLVVYNRSKALWGSGTEGKAIEYLQMQSDGNLVMYGYDKKPVWASNTLGNDGARLEIQDDGNVVIYAPSSNRAVWETRTYDKGCG